MSKPLSLLAASMLDPTYEIWFRPDAQVRNLLASRPATSTNGVSREWARRIANAKDRTTFKRAAQSIEAAPDGLFEIITAFAFQLKPSQSFNSRTVEIARMTALTSLPGVGIPVGSAILSWTEPTRFPVIDRHAWKALTLFNVTEARERLNDFTAEAWADYVEIIADLGSTLDQRRDGDSQGPLRSPQEIDTWLYNCGRHNGAI